MVRNLAPQSPGPFFCRQRAAAFLSGISICIFLTAPGIASQNETVSNLRKNARNEAGLGHYSQAEVLLKEALDGALRANNQYEIALTYSALADTYQQEMRLEDAEHLYRKSISILLTQPDRGHALAIMWRNLASALTAETNYREALASLDRAYQLVQTSKLVDPQLNAQILNGRGVIYFYQGKFGKAKSHFVRAAQITLVATEPGDLSGEDILNNLARVYHNTGQFAKAEETYKQALTVAEMHLGIAHPDLVTPLSNLGALCSDLKRYKEAENYFQRSLQILEQSGAPFNESTLMQVLHGLGKTYMRENDQIRAESVLSRAAEIAHRNLNQTFLIPEILQVFDDYSKVLRDLWNPVDADRLYAEAQRIRASRAFTVPVKAK